MPLYEYKCSNCAHRFERIVKFSDAPLTTCPKCHKETIEQLISAPAIQFKGSGWYVSDYGGKNGSGLSGSNASEGSSESAPASKDSGSSEGSTASKSSDSPTASTPAAASASSSSDSSGSANASSGGSKSTGGEGK
ncbi:MAG TPA: zinc ribbon domain-containing protein [Candidatus Saccharimonadales bacterium]|nr:zinc ribbon domain-containing protein [Candidatus Saccharimonadales bacterium]